MRKRLLAFFLILLIGVAGGCLGDSNSTTSTTPPTESSSSSIPTPTKTTTTTSQNPIEVLKTSLEEIEEFTYLGRTSIHMNVTVLMGNLSQNNTIALSMLESGYIDFTSTEAVINTTTITEPDNTTLRTVRIIKDGKTYLKTTIGAGISSLNVTENTSPFIWNYNPASLARKYITENPDEVIRNGETTELTYTLSWQDVKALAILYLAVTEDTGIEIKGGRLTLTFEGGELKGVELEYTVVTTSVVQDPILGQMTIKISAKGLGSYEITSINKKMNVETPT